MGVATSLPRQHPTPPTTTTTTTIATHPFCWWFITPSLPSPLTSLELSLFLSHLNSPNSATPPLSYFNITLQFSSNYTNPQDQEDSFLTPHCSSERVLVYDGVPKFILPFSRSDSNIRNDSNGRPGSVPWYADGASSVPNTGKLLAAYGGMELGCARLSVVSSWLTVVYYSSSSVLTLCSDGGGRGRGFEASVTSQKREGQGEGLQPEEGGANEGSGLTEVRMYVCVCVCVLVPFPLKKHFTYNVVCSVQNVGQTFFDGDFLASMQTHKDCQEAAIERALSCGVPCT